MQWFLVLFVAAVITIGVAQKANTQPQPYKVAFVNLLGETLPEIVIFWQYPGQGVNFERATNIAFNQQWEFNLGSCNPNLTYSAGIAWSGGFKKFPEQGMITPATAPTLNPQDTDPCIDAWGITYDFVR